MDPNTLLYSLPPAVVLACWLWLHQKRRLPPGPPRKPIIGNLLDMPQKHAWLKFSEWAETYGDLVYLEVMGSKLLVVNSAYAANELLDRKSTNYSDRPHFTMGGVAGLTENFAMLPYGEEWRQQRKFVASEFTAGSILRYAAVQEREAREFVERILENPDKLRDYVRRSMGAIIMRIIYGYETALVEDPFLSLSDKSMAAFVDAFVPGRWLCDSIPILRYVPDWFPGAGFKQTAMKWKQLAKDVSWNPYLWSKRNTETGYVLLPNLITRVLEQNEGQLDVTDETRLVWACSAAFGGGLDTNMATLLTFFLAMTLFPDVQARAQQEIQNVIGNDRLPCLSDRDQLPYVECLIAEIFRWRPPIPLSIAHAVREDDAYQGQYIPAGTTVLANVWHMLHDPASYPDPESVMPERFLEKPELRKHAMDLVFGFGRRRCPGIYFAEATAFAMISTVLATCHVHEVKEANDNIDYSSELISFPAPFTCKMTPRSGRVMTLLAQATEGPAL